MSDTASIHSNDGSASDNSEVSQSTTQTPLRSFSERFGADGGGTPLTKANLKKVGSFLANEVRLNQAPGKVDRISAAFARIPEAKLAKPPNKMERQLLEEKSGVSPMQRWEKTVDDTRGGSVDDEFWNDLKLNDRLAAEIDELS